MTYQDDWSSQEDMLRDFEVGPEVLKGATVLLASYTYENYEGDAYVLFERDGDLFEVHGSHCSCYGLEGQWEPEATTKEAILHRLDKGTWGQESKLAGQTRAILERT